MSATDLELRLELGLGVPASKLGTLDVGVGGRSSAEKGYEEDETAIGFLIWVT